MINQTTDFVSNEKLKKLQEIELEILKYVVEFCEKNDITYYLMFGTLIGAARHNGFIPWDDDLDIVMPYDDYIKFCTLIKENITDPYEYQSFDTDNNYPDLIVRIRKKGTVYKEPYFARFNLKNYGCWIDIYPLYDAKNYKSISTKIQYLLGVKIINRIAYHRAFKDFEGFSFVRKIIHYVSCIFPLKWWISLREWIFKLNQNKGYNCYAIFVPAKLYVHSKEHYNPARKLYFGDREYSVPNKYDALLRSIYGDYMKYPPKEQQKLAHEPLEWKV